MRHIVGVACDIVRIVRRPIPVEHGRDAGVVDPQQPNPFGTAPREVSGFVWKVETEPGRRVVCFTGPNGRKVAFLMPDVRVLSPARANP